MKIRYLIVTALAALLLGGCATYGYRGGTGGDYYYGRSSGTGYYGAPYGSVGYGSYGGYGGVYGSVGYGYPRGYSRYSYWPGSYYGSRYYGYYPPYYGRPIVRPRPIRPRPPPKISTTISTALTATKTTSRRRTIVLARISRVIWRICRLSSTTRTCTPFSPVIASPVRPETRRSETGPAGWRRMLTIALMAAMARRGASIVTGDRS